MIDTLRRNPIIAVLALVALALAAVLAVESQMGEPDASSARARRGVAAEAKLLPPLAAVAPEQAYPETAARPLFTPTRRPAPEAAVAAQPAFQRGQFVLLGVTVAGDTRIAMLREKSSGRLHRVERGREVNGIKVVAIEPDSVVLAQGAEQEHIPMQVQRPGAPGQPGAVPAPTALTPGGGPFAAAANAPGTPASPGTRVPGGQPFGVPGTPLPAAAPGAPHAATPGANPAAGVASNVPPGVDAAGAPLSPEELLARRRARRAQQNQ